MSLVGLVVTLVIIGILLYVIEAFIPMDAAIKRIIQIVVILVCVLIVLNAFAILGSLGTVRVPQVR